MLFFQRKSRFLVEKYCCPQGNQYFWHGSMAGKARGSHPRWCFLLFERFKRFSRYFKKLFFSEAFFISGRTGLVFRQKLIFPGLAAWRARPESPRYEVLFKKLHVFTVLFELLENHQFWPKSLAGKPKSSQILGLLMF